ncbi:hypothetical protein J2W32_000314 [Variovorax boronicumulans]|uniref:Uncharacterized protein n=1 Tax=Variovorax boronicumulans TaxID=436515 RepID=A0AAW8CLR8_9BURK|nr:hypothetical protein [Variovorax boronicumulans]MDP9891217.1 hypothetical protein [Variovorax boronicumulans]MDQ0051285.1 hypothetical protein [Variovorax boronicumulans]
MKQEELESFNRCINASTEAIQKYVNVGPTRSQAQNVIDVRWGAFVAAVQDGLTGFQSFIAADDVAAFPTVTDQLQEAASSDPNVVDRSTEILGLIEALKDQWHRSVTRARERAAADAKARDDEINEFRVRLANQVGELEQSQRNLNEFLVASKNEIADLKSKLANSVIAFEETLDKFRDQEKWVDGVRRKTAKHGLAGAFGDRARGLTWSKYSWAALLGASLFFIYLNGQSVLTALQADVKWQIQLTQALLSFPLIWAAWFGAKQFAYASRLQEDYEFKVASAMSYEGYKQEASELGDAMKLKLIESAISTYSENPLRIYNIPSDPGTPLQEILESFSKIDKVVEAAAKWRKPEA